MPHLTQPLASHQPTFTYLENQFGGINRTRAESRLTIFLSFVTGGFSPYINGLLYYNDDIQRPRCRASTPASFLVVANIHPLLSLVC